MLEIEYTKSFLRDSKKFKHVTKIKLLTSEVVNNLINNINLEARYCNHKLKRNLGEYYECHILPDLILIYKISDNTLILKRLCKHSEL